MSDFLKYCKIERLHKIYEAAKEVSILLGADPLSFKETDKKLSEIRRIAKNKISGGISALQTPEINNPHP